jgi:hypothetical protein
MKIITKCPECKREVASYATLVLFALFMFVASLETIRFLMVFSR